MKLHTYLNYGGNCEQAFRFYEQHLGGKITMMMRHGEQPGPSQLDPAWNGKILHARISLGETELLGADIPPDRFQPMRSAYLSLTLGSIDEAERIYALLSDGGEIFMPMAETFFAHRFAMLRDKFGTSWMLLHPKPQAAQVQKCAGSERTRPTYQKLSVPRCLGVPSRVEVRSPDLQSDACRILGWRAALGHASHHITTRVWRT